MSFTEDGFLDFLGAPPQYDFPTPGAAVARPEAAARSFLLAHRRLFGVTSAAVDFDLLKLKTANGRIYVRLQEIYSDIPVFAGELIVQINSRHGVECVLSDLARNTADLDQKRLSTAPAISAAAATVQVRGRFAEKAPRAQVTTTPPRLMLFSPPVLGDAGSMRLVWELKTGSEDAISLDAQILVDAHTGEVLREYPLHYDALNRQIYDANNTTTDPGTLERSEGGAASTIADVNSAYDHLGATFFFYFSEHARNSIDGNGLTLSATTRWCCPNGVNQACPGAPCPWPNAQWTSNGRMYFGSGWAVDDITGHELTHGVTSYESALVYANASGAINESFSDVWGEFIDLTDAVGNDAPSVRWEVGEDLPGGRIRNMKDPSGQPDRLNSPSYVPPVGDPQQSNDWGGVHTNSGVNNKLCYLLTDGDTFNGQSVYGMGISRVADLYYEVNTNLLTSGADWTALFRALQQAAYNLGWNDADQTNLYRACAAVEIVSSPREVYVDFASTCPFPAGLPDCSLLSLGPYPTVGQGMAGAYPGNILWVKGGIYPEAPTLGKVITIKAYDGTVVIGQLTAAESRGSRP